MRFGGLAAPLVPSQPWRLVCAMFLHFSAIHILMNMAALYQVGILLERRYGSTVYSIVYFLGGLAGAGGSYAWQTMGHPAISAGASARSWGSSARRRCRRTSSAVHRARRSAT